MSDSSREGAPTNSGLRFIGARSFADEEMDRRLFHGRDRETQDLLQQLRTQYYVIVTGVSVIGKTSFLQAGVFPCLRAAHFLPVSVSVTDPARPDAVITAAISSACAQQGLARNVVTSGDLFRRPQSLRGASGNQLLMAVLVLDSFEQVYESLDTAQREAWLREIVALCSEQKPPGLKLIISVREEYLEAVRRTFKTVEHLRQAVYAPIRLKSLERDNAERILKNTAAVDNGRFSRPEFAFEAPAMQELLDFLQDGSDGIEPLQLQLLGRDIEQRISLRPESGRFVVDLSHSGGVRRFQQVLQEHYMKTVDALPTRRARNTARLLCEEGLLSPEKNRESIGEKRLLRTYPLTPRELKVLVNAALLRRSTGLGGFTYTLAHPNLGAVVMQYRRSNISTSAFLGIVSIVLVSAGVVAWQFHEAAGFRRSAHEQQLPQMVRLSAGVYMMGAVPGDADAKDNEFPQHRVTIDYSFSISKYEITFAQYDVFAASTGRAFPDDEGWGRGHRPVINVSWHDAQAYTHWLSQQTGVNYRLPTEAEWEYAARAGSANVYWWGEIPGVDQANCRGCTHRWKSNQTTPVGSFAPNGFALHDTAGNVAEWVQDCYHDNYQGAPSDGTAWITEPCAERVMRGGAWYNLPSILRTSLRSGHPPAWSVNNGGGFRVASD